MAEMEEMETLKKVYAEMILNTAKKAAARVMEAELRARRMKQEVNSAKEEAAALLLRLKQMIDAKSKEAESTSMNLQKKYEELESQLNEAEGIIIDLRAELNQTEQQLYEVKKKRMQIDVQNEEILEQKSSKANGMSSGCDLLTPSLNLGPEISTVSGDTLNVIYDPEPNGCSDDDEPVLDQIKQPERFRNGCTQRIVATETSNYVVEEKDQLVKDDAVFIGRRSLRKRKLKMWGDFITSSRKRRSYQNKRPQKPISHSTSSKVKKCVRYGDGPDTASFNHVEVSKEFLHDVALPESMELIDVLVTTDEMAVKLELNSSSRIECTVEDDTAI